MRSTKIAITFSAFYIGLIVGKALYGDNVWGYQWLLVGLNLAALFVNFIRED